MSNFKIPSGSQEVVFEAYCEYYFSHHQGSLNWENYDDVLTSFHEETGLGLEDDTFLDNREFFIEVARGTKYLK